MDEVVEALTERISVQERQLRELRKLLRTWKMIYDDGNMELNRRTERAITDL